jgi:hypothetical protein
MKAWHGDFDGSFQRGNSNLSFSSIVSDAHEEKSAVHAEPEASQSGYTENDLVSLTD